MDHGCQIEMQGVPAQIQGIVFLHRQGAALQIHVIELTDELEGLVVAHHLQVRVAQQQLLNAGTMIRLHVVDHQIVQGSAVQGVQDIFQELTGNGGIHRIHQRCFFVQYQIRIVRHAPGEGKQVLKQCQTAVAPAYPDNGIGDLTCAVHAIAFLFFTILCLGLA